MAWGKDCSSWDDAVDHANLEAFDYEEIPEDRFVMTTWHEKESLEEVFGYSKRLAFHDAVDIERTLILHVASQDRADELLSEYAGA